MTVINRAHAERVAAEDELVNLPESIYITDAKIHAMIDSLGDVGEALNSGKAESLSLLYERLRLDLRCDLRENVVDVTSSLRGLSEAGVARYSPAVHNS